MKEDLPQGQPPEQPPEAPSTPPLNECNDPGSPHETASTPDDMQQLIVSRPSSVATLTERGALRRTAAICLQRYVRGFLVRRQHKVSPPVSGATLGCANSTDHSDGPGLCFAHPGDVVHAAGFGY